MKLKLQESDIEYILARYYSNRKDIWRILLPYLDHKEGGIFLNLGCGSSTAHSFLVKGFEFGVNVDKEKYVVRRAKESARNIICQDFVVGIGESLPFTSDVFSRTLLTNVLEHLVSPSQVLKEVSRTLKCNAEVLIVTTSLSNPAVMLDKLLMGLFDKLKIVFPYRYYRANSIRVLVKQLKEASLIPIFIDFAGGVGPYARFFPRPLAFFLLFTWIKIDQILGSLPFKKMKMMIVLVARRINSVTKDIKSQL